MYRLLLAAPLALVVAGAALAAPGDPQKRIKPADQAYARALVARRAELPAGSWRASPTDFSQANPPCAVRSYSLAALTLNGEAGTTYTQSTGLAAGGLLVESDGDVFATPAQAAKALHAVTSTGLASCLATSLASGARAAGTTAQVVAPTTLPPSAGWLGWQFLLRLSRGGATRTLEVTQVARLRGRALASIGVVRTRTTQPWAPLVPLERAVSGRMTRR